MYLIIYFVAAFLLLGVLDFIIYRVGCEIARCPKAPPGAHAAALAVASGYAAIGAGGVVLAGVIVPAANEFAIYGLFVGLGVACISLGLGFAQAMANLRANLDPIPAQASAAAPAPAPAVA